MLSETSWTTLHKVLACAMLSQKYEDNIDLDYFLCNVVWSLLDNIVQDLYLFNVGPWPTDYFYKENNPCNMLWPCWDNIAQCFYLLNVCPWRTDNFYKENILCNIGHARTTLYNQCWLDTSEKTLHKKLLAQGWPRAHRNVFTGK